MKTLAPIRPRSWKRDLVTWPFESFFDRFFEEGEALADWAPTMDVVEKPEAYIAKVEVPGMDPEDIKVTLEGRELTVKGERMKEEVSEEGHFRVRERSFGSFVRTFTFPLPVDEKGIDAAFEKGLLTIEVKKAEEAKPTRIEVKSK